MPNFTLKPNLGTKNFGPNLYKTILTTVEVGREVKVGFKGLRFATEGRRKELVDFGKCF